MMRCLRLTVLMMLSFVQLNATGTIPSHDKIAEMYQQFESDCAKFCYEPKFEVFYQPSLRHAVDKNLPDKINLKKMNFDKPFPAYDKVALVSMVKDEGDMIFPNLCWHYFMGFRKFIIIDNGSTDNTVKLIDLFKDITANSASVIRVDDSRVLYLQTSRMNALVKLAETIFPEVTWILPNDADELITLDKSLENTLSEIPNDINCIHSPRITYIASDDYFTYAQDKPFYERIHIAHKRNPYGYKDNFEWNGKTFIRAHKGLLLLTGNHLVSNTSINRPSYIAGPECGFHIREFPLRSPEHALKKIINMGKAQKKIDELHPGRGRHYAHIRYERYLEIGDVVGLEEFKQFMTKGGCSFDETMPLDLAIKTLIPAGSANELIYKELVAVQP